MGLYNMLHGESRSATDLLSFMGLTRDSFYRYRDCYLSEQGEIAVYTRGGGNNRECYCAAADAHDPDGHCAVEIQTPLRSHPLYLRDVDDEFDCTYSTWFFKLPEAANVSGMQPEKDRDTVWRETFRRLENQA